MCSDNQSFCRSFSRERVETDLSYLFSIGDGLSDDESLDRWERYGSHNEKEKFLDAFASLIGDFSFTLEEQGYYCDIGDFRKLHEAEGTFRHFWKLLTDRAWPRPEDAYREIRSKLGIERSAWVRLLRSQEVNRARQSLKQWIDEGEIKTKDRDYTINENNYKLPPLDVEKMHNLEWLEVTFEQTKSHVDTLYAAFPAATPDPSIIEITPENEESVIAAFEAQRKAELAESFEGMELVARRARLINEAFQNSFPHLERNQSRKKGEK